ncbi:DUF1858 domain-containing protein [Pseudobacteroides cellulosolvens]|uniref:DUF1858 domain-containing protein n=1 Tax=Pseudobacteroides cellulosolvens ATCC 35603 = DSM 2933 TaxID=398512 RepID=A0A0L6JHH3_9FIRM|nr:DUF1858 domain-containing protein [Pseudobacteroides cellulosolvens]KNY25174.1 protein of unknown function DUF1858 [Pseudobacteroides cellulosolvens ATCC 35603 = DSM 2933]
MKINSQSNVKEIINKYPQTLPIFSTVGFNGSSIDDLMDEVGETSMLKTILEVKDINQDQ